METNEVIQGLMDDLGIEKNIEFARLINVDGSTVTGWLKKPGEKRARTPKPKSIGPLLKLATPERQVQLLQALGVEDPMALARELLESMGVIVLDAQSSNRPRFRDIEPEDLPELMGA